MVLDPAARADVGDPAMCGVRYWGSCTAEKGVPYSGRKSGMGMGVPCEYWQPRWKCRTKGSQCSGSRESGKECKERECGSAEGEVWCRTGESVVEVKRNKRL